MTRFPKMKYRYACQACTNVAFKSMKIEEGKMAICESCGKVIATIKENYIKL